MHTLNYREHPIPSLYVKSANQTWHIRAVFLMARRMAPCLLIFEDIDTIVTPNLRSYFFNEVDGLEQNDGIMIVASTNHREFILSTSPTYNQITDMAFSISRSA